MQFSKVIFCLLASAPYGAPFTPAPTVSELRNAFQDVSEERPKGKKVNLPLDGTAIAGIASTPPTSIASSPPTKRTTPGKLNWKDQARLARPSLGHGLVFLPAVWKRVGAMVKQAAVRKPSLAGLVVAGGLYLLYSYLVQQYARGVVQKMMNVPAPEALLGTEHHLSSFTITPSDLRPTVSESTNLVTNPDDCLKWHQWIIANRNDKSKVGPDTIRSFATKADQDEQIFRYRYRTYMNFEETYSVHRPYWTWQRFVYSFLDVTKLQFFPATKTTTQGSEAAPIATAQVQDKQCLFGGLLRLRITWFGTVIPQPKDDSGDLTIAWESTKAEIFFPWNRKRPGKIIENPKLTSKMASDPWDIVKLEDGMMCVKRGTVGYLVYDSQQA